MNVCRSYEQCESNRLKVGKKIATFVLLISFLTRDGKLTRIQWKFLDRDRKLWDIRQ